MTKNKSPLPKSNNLGSGLSPSASKKYLFLNKEGLRVFFANVGHVALIFEQT